ncbi:TonB-dependent receptor [Luteimonas deserti]|uniref:TonB-dependent receptor n=1 Tax=Luteimonas deserti TaxID=2752306 RepID=A0A7Z0QM67_9GAMM|nr:TonB-dependent receptor [Luteimonas deserti]NYZ61168.1 TonB-dependent receptor [Luteimonas deserti]
MNRLRAVPKQRLLTSALLLAIASPAIAQVNEPSAPSDATDLDAVVVTGIRGSLESSMNLKRDARGIVDGIIAEDIGKFPDTNLAESLQRISGVSIDRSAIGEGSRVTVRGVGPDFNLVLLNGRQMPASSNGDGSTVSNSRAFDFANLASEAISAVEVYKSGRAETPTGGIGATINIKTARPLENPGFRANLGIKGVHDTSLDNLPDQFKGSSVTPEVSGIFSTTTADGRFGIAVTGSYQERDLGYNQVSVPGGWRGFRGDEENWGAIPQPGTPGSENIVNRPGPGDVYSVPQNLNYAVTGVQRQRTNGQVVLQWAPTDTLTTTLDYTYSENKIQQQRNDMSVWFNYGPSSSSWTDGPVAAPLLYSEALTFNDQGQPNYTDLSMGGADFANRNENKSLGFNVEWEATDRLGFELDVHKSTAETSPDSPYGSGGVLGAAAFIRGRTTADFSGDFPILTVEYPPGYTAPRPSDMLVTGSVFHRSYMKSEIEQVQARGNFRFGDYSRLDFGVAATEADNRTAYGNVQRDTWGGTGAAGDYADDLWRPANMGRYFNQFAGHDNPAFTDAFFLFDFNDVRNAAVRVLGDEAAYLAPAEYTTDRRVTEKSRSAYLQVSSTFDIGIPLNAAAGVRYEETDVTSSALVPVATALVWGANNEIGITREGSDFTTLTGEYAHWLPSIDVSAEFTDSLILRSSYSRTIGRPGWGDIQGGQTLNAPVRVDGGTGQQGNPGLLPLKAHNFDLSLEWYYAEASYFSVGYFQKNIGNYIGTSIIQATPFDLRTPIGGAYWNAAVANACATADLTCIRNYIFTNFNGQPGVVRGDNDSNGNATGTITGQPNDPIAEFRITTPANTGSSKLDGLELNLQHVFGQSGFGLAANYTYVDSPDLNYDNSDLGGQFALVGLSDSANLVLFYDKGPWQARAAYNWRDKFLSSGFDSERPNPVYVEEYGQLDVSVGYRVSDNLTLQAEAINVTDETQRSHGRNARQLLYGTQTGPRYMFGLRYTF